MLIKWRATLLTRAFFVKNGGLLEKKGKMCHKICRSVRNPGANFLRNTQKWYLYLLKEF